MYSHFGPEFLFARVFCVRPRVPPSTSFQFFRKGVNLMHDIFFVGIDVRLGFTKVGTLHQCGRKFERPYNMIWMEKML